MDVRTSRLEKEVPDIITTLCITTLFPVRAYMVSHRKFLDSYGENFDNPTVRVEDIERCNGRSILLTKLWSNIATLKVGVDHMRSTDISIL